jgi:ketosteroid isomerase-like protein
MTDTHDSGAAIVSGVYGAFARRDLHAALALFHAEADWIQPEALPWGGVYQGPNEIARFFSRLGEHVEGGRVEADHTLEAGEHVVVLGRFRGRSRATGREFAVELCHVWRVVDGRITWFRNYVDTAALLRALGAPAQQRPRWR